MKIRHIFFQKGSSDTCYGEGESQKHYAKCKRPDTNSDVLYDPTYRKVPEWANPQRQRGNENCQGLGEGEGEQLLDDIGFLFLFGCAQGMQNFLGQGLNPGHSSDPSHCSDNASSLNHCATREV